MDVTPGKQEPVTEAPVESTRSRARELADEILGRGAAIARAAIGPLGVASRVAVVAGLVVWAALPAPWWESPPHLVFALVALFVLVLPGIRLRRHRARMQAALEGLPSMLAEVEGALRSMPGSLEDLSRRWQGGAAGRTGIVGTGRRCWRFYREGIAPLREQSPGAALGKLNDAISAFAGPALVLSGIALAMALALVLAAPIAVVVRLIFLAS